MTINQSMLTNVPWLKWGLLGTLIAFAIFSLLPHHIHVNTTRATLPNGKTIEVQMTLRSPWGWLAPTQINELHVRLDGNELWLPKEAYYGIGPVAIQREPTLALLEGFPEIIVYGRQAANFQELHLSFLNNQFSQRRIIRDHHEETAFFANPHPSISIAKDTIVQPITPSSR